MKKNICRNFSFSFHFQISRRKSQKKIYDMACFHHITTCFKVLFTDKNTTFVERVSAFIEIRKTHYILIH